MAAPNQVPDPALKQPNNTVKDECDIQRGSSEGKTHLRKLVLLLPYQSTQVLGLPVWTSSRLKSMSIRQFLVESAQLSPVYDPGLLHA